MQTAHSVYNLQLKSSQTFKPESLEFNSNSPQIINIKTGVIEGVFFDTKPIHSVGYKDGVVAAGGVSCYIHVGDFNQVIWPSSSCPPLEELSDILSDP